MIVGLLLAAGGARRFKAQKLVAPLRGVPLVRRAATALAEATDGMVVVVGADSQAVRAALSGLDATVVENADWERGLSTSLRCGILALPAECEATVVGLGDQPGVDSRVIAEVVQLWKTTRLPIVSARYRGVRGHPVLFARGVFPELAELAGDAGARLLIERSAERVAYVDVDADVPKDVDTPEGLAELETDGESTLGGERE